VLVSYESSPAGRAALLHAAALARREGAALTVVSVATTEPTDVGCGRCRQGAAIWNREMRSMADETLAEARMLLEGSPMIDYEVAVGSPREAVARSAATRRADVIVVPSEATGRLRRLLSPSTAERLRRAGRWQVVVAPSASDAGRAE
jgi:nucleotide-binding universal stress UspA family protein